MKYSLHSSRIQIMKVEMINGLKNLAKKDSIQL